jgi:hypothetical protein
MVAAILGMTKMVGSLPELSGLANFMRTNRHTLANSLQKSNALHCGFDGAL